MAGSISNAFRCALVAFGSLLVFAICVNSASVHAEKPASISGDTAEYLTVPGVTGVCGGSLVTAFRSDPKTLNPLIAIDGASKELIGLLNADLIHINRYTQATEPGLASSWNISPDGRTFTVNLRHGIRFSDGQPFDADDVVFTFHAYLDERTHSPQRDLLMVGGVPISVRKVSRYRIVFSLSQPYAAAERLFDSVAILPKHLLEKAYTDDRLASIWDVNSDPKELAGLGPFQIEEYIPGQRITLKRNPFYWKKDSAGHTLPYLDRIISLIVRESEAEELAFRDGNIDLISRFDPQDFSLLEAGADDSYHVYDAGPGFEYTFLVFNQSDIAGLGDPNLAQRQSWFRQTAFRQAVSSVADRDAMVRLAYSGRAYPLAVQISPGNRNWLDGAIPRPVRSVSEARDLLRTAQFSWSGDGSLKDALGQRVQFSILYNANKAQHERLAAVLQQDLKDLGINANPVPMDFGTLVDRVFNRLNYDTAIMTLADGDADPNTEVNVLLSTGGAHLWNLRTKRASEAWQNQIDQLMKEQMTTLDHARRKQLFNRVQEIMWREQPFVFLLSPDILAGANARVLNFKPAVLSSYTLWNADQLSVVPSRAADSH